MHLTGGQFKGRIITNPRGETITVKPTLSKVRESVFNVLSSHFGSFEDLTFLDMFTGSGIIALEAESRGFKEVYAIEYDPKVFFTLQKVFRNFNSKSTLLKGNSLKLAEKLPQFDVIYIDPPWDYNYTPIIEIALSKLTEGGLVVVEYDKKKAKSPYQYKGKEILPFKEKIYGRCMVDFLCI